MNIFYFIHLLILLFVILLPLTPIKYLKYIYFTPVVLPIVWVIFKKCPLNDMHKDDIKKYNNKFFYSITKRVFPNINVEQSYNVATLLLLLSVIISSIRIMIYYKIYKK